MACAGYDLPETTSCAETPVAWSITWLLVSTRPLEEMTIPVPSAVASLYFSCEVMSTIPGSTLAAIAWTFSGPDPVLVPPLLPLPAPLLGAAPKPFPLNGFSWPLLPPGLVLVGDCAFDEEAVR